MTSKDRDQLKTMSGTRRKETPSRIPRSPMPVKPKDRDWKETQKKAEGLGARRYSELTRTHLEGNKEGLQKHIENLAYRLRRKPFGRWTTQEMEEAQKYFGPDGINTLRTLQEKDKQRR